MKKFGKFCTITALILGILGIVFVVGGFAAGASLVTLRNDLYEEGDYGHDRIFSFWKNLNKRHSGSGAVKVSADTFGADKEIRCLEVDIQHGDVEFCYGDEDGKDLKEGEILVEKRIHEDIQTIDVGVEYGTLRIVEDKSGIELDDADYWNDGGGKITIYVAEGVSFEKVQITDGTGDVSVNRDLDIGELSVDLGTGDFSGDGSIRTSEGLRIVSGTGDIDLEDFGCMGDVFVMTGVGDVDVQGELGGDMTVSNGTGDISITLSGSIDNCNYDLSAGVGEVNVNGQSFDGLGQTVKQNNNPDGSTITAESGVGDIDLDVN